MWIVSKRYSKMYAPVNLQSHINGLVQDCSFSSADALHTLKSCTKPSKCGRYYLPLGGPKQVARYYHSKGLPTCIWTVAWFPLMLSKFCPEPQSMRSTDRVRSCMHIRACVYACLFVYMYKVQWWCSKQAIQSTCKQWIKSLINYYQAG